MKKAMSFMMSVVLIWSAFSVETFAATKKGDMNEDGKLTLSDARVILKAAAGITKLTEAQMTVADVNGDGEVSSYDASLLLQSVIDLPVSMLGKLTQYTPKKKSTSSSKSIFCTVTADWAETLPGNETDDKSNPLYTPLPKGTSDYVTSGPFSSGDKTYYVLKSGRRVYANEISVFTGYNLPDNKITVHNCAEYTGDETKIFLGLSWRVPFAAVIKPQSYESGYSGRVFNNVDDEFTGSYMDITFDYTVAASGTPSVSKSGIIKSMKWIVNTDTKRATLRLYFRNAGVFYGYTAYYNDNNYLVLSVKENSNGTSLKGKTITVDPGHGGYQPGAGSGTGVYEKVITYKIAVLLKQYLEKEGATVIMTRDDSDTAPEIEERRFTCMNTNPDMFVSIHLDANDGHSVHGSSVYYYKNYSGPLAYAISRSLPSAANEVGYPLTNRGCHFYPFLVTRVENCPSVLIECGFISNTTNVVTPSSNTSSGKSTSAKNDFSFLNSALGQQYIAKGIYNGIKNYYKTIEGKKA